MSVQKKLQTLANNKSIIDIYPGNNRMSLLRKEINIKSKEMFQVSSDREITVENFGYDRTGAFRVREIFTKNFVMEVTLARNGVDCQLKNNWADLLKKRIREKVGGEQEIVKHGWADTIQTYREAENQEIRDKYSLLTEGNGQSLTLTAASPTIVGYTMLNIQSSSINPHIAQYYPNYQLNSSSDFDIEFQPSSEILVSGTAPIMTKCRILYEYAAPLHNRVLRSKFDKGQPGQGDFKPGGEELTFHEMVSYEYPLTNGSADRSVKLRSFPTSEIDELVFVFSLDSDAHKLKTQKCSQIKLTMSDREIVDAPNAFQEMKALFRNELPNKYKVGGVEQDFNVLDLTPLNYKEQEKKMWHVQGVILSEEDLLLEFLTPTNANGTLFIYGVKKVFNLFKNGNLKRIY